jgi:hypothetical protein
MNRLIIIGNGFDLAHGYKTSYSDFLEDYLIQILNEYFVKHQYEDDLIKFNYQSIQFSKPIEAIKSIEESFKYIELIKERFPKVIDFKSDFFKELYMQFNHQRWVDIENHYFSYLKRYSKASNNDLKSIIKLNNEFEFLKSKLVDYLKRASSETRRGRVNYIPELTTKPFEQEEFVENLGTDKVPKQLYFLNFNYTNTIEYYTPYLSSKFLYDVNYIHGDINDDNNPIIFGYGDEYDKEYLEIQNKQIHELLKHIKSFQYSKTSNYHHLMRFIQGEPFQVYVLGHSLGLSDRTMLKEIFEHDNCKSIKIFYHKKSETENDFTEKVYELANHFTDKGLMRKKLVPFDKSSKI